MRALSVILIVLVSAHSYASDFFVASGFDASNGTDAAFTSSDMGRMDDENDVGMQSNSAWSGMEKFNESRYLEFAFSPSLPNGSIINNANLTFKYRRDGALDGAMLKIWNNVSWLNESIGIPLDASTYNTTNATQTINLSYINSTAAVNSFRFRFLAYRNAAGTSQKTSHDFIRLSVNYTPPEAVIINYPAAGSNVSGIVLINWSFAGNVLINISYSYNSSWVNTSTNVSNDGLYEWNTTELADSRNYTIRIMAYNDTTNMIAENASGIFTIDNSKPSIGYAIVSPRKAGIGQEINLTAGIIDNFGVESAYVIFYNATHNSSAAMSYSNRWLFIFNTENMTGAYSVNLTASDYSGNSITIAADNISISERYEGGYTSGLFGINGTAEVRERLSVNTTINISLSAVLNNVSMSVAEYNSAPNLSTLAKYHMGKFIEIQFPFTFEWAVIRLYYKVGELGELDEASLRLYFYNESSGSWIAGNSGVNKTRNYVWANTTHMSVWGIFGDLVQATTSIPGSGSSSRNSDSGSGGCSSSYSLLAPEIMIVTENSTVNLSVTLSNTGTCGLPPKAIKLKVPKSWAGSNVTTRYLGAYESQSLNMTVRIPSNASGSHNITASAKTGSKTVAASILFIIQGREDDAGETNLQRVFKSVEGAEGIKVFSNESNATKINERAGTLINKSGISATGFVVYDNMNQETLWIINTLLLVFIVMAIAWLLEFVDENRFRKRMQMQIELSRSRKALKKKEDQVELKKIKVRVHG